MKSPLALVKERFESKEKLVAAVKAFASNEDLWLGRTNESKGLERVSNAKLLRLHQTFTQVKEKFGTRAKLVDAVLAAQNRSKDTGLKKRLEAYPVPRLFDLYKSVSKGTKAAEKAEPKAAAKAAPKAKAEKAAPKAKAEKAAPKAKG